jgi:hypothetical protein
MGYGNDPVHYPDTRGNASMYILRCKSGHRLTPKDKKDTDLESSLEVGLVVDSPREEATGKDDRCVTISQKKPLRGCPVQLLVQDLVLEAVKDTSAVVSIFGTEQYGSPGCKPSSFPDASWFG